MQDWLAVAIAVALLLGLTLLAIYAVYLIAPQAPTEAKRRRYEAGNPPHGEPKAPLAMQYFGYVLMLVTLEPLVVLPIVYFALKPTSLASAAMVLAALALVAAASIYGYAHSRDIRKWTVD